jgi:hypothetical protein
MFHVFGDPGKEWEGQDKQDDDDSYEHEWLLSIASIVE